MTPARDVMRPLLYLDHNASSPMSAGVRAHLTRVLQDPPGNPGSVHAVGQQARGLLERARRGVMKALGVSHGRVVFTSSATEANALALHALAPDFTLRCARVEHPSVVAQADARSRAGLPVAWLDHDAVGAPLVPDSARGAQLAVVLANNELGTWTDVDAFASCALEHDALLHVDASQVVGRLPWTPPPGVTSVTLSAHKSGGPVGIGALWFTERVDPTPLLIGGHQERGARAGTENVLLIDAWATALQQGPDPAWAALGAVRDAFETTLVQTLGAVINGGGHRLPNTTNLSIPGVDAETALMALDLDGVCASAGSACTAGSIDPSPTIAALGVSGWRLHNALRFSFGPEHADADGVAIAERVAQILSRARDASG